MQVQKFLGHADPGFTLRTYVHLLDEDLPATDFLAAAGNTWATRPPETARNGAVVATVEMAARAGETSETARQREAVAANS